MSTWTNVTDTVLEPGQPIRSVDIIAIKNNILAVPAGAANAPRVQTGAIQDLAVTTAKLANGSVTLGKLHPPNAGNNIICRVQDSQLNGSGSTGYPDAPGGRANTSRDHISCNILLSGVVRLTVEHRNAGAGTQNTFVRVLRNGSQLVEWSKNNQTFTIRTLDITVSIGDVITLQQRSGFTGSPPRPGQIRNFRILSGNITPAAA